MRHLRQLWYQARIRRALWKIVGLGTPPDETRTPNQAAAEEDAQRRNAELSNAGPTEAFYTAEQVGPDQWQVVLWQVVFRDGKPKPGLRGLITSFNRALGEMRDLPPT
jgi:hypothetical protein